MINITNPNTLNLADTVKLINEKKMPAIFWDTCSLMDIIRIPFPSRKNHPDTDLRIIEIKNFIIRGEVLSLASSMTIKEFNDNMPNEIDSFKRDLAKLNIEVNKYIGFINKSNPGILLSSLDLPNYKLETYYCDIARSIIDNTVFISDEQSFKDKAHSRVVDKITPAKVKGEYKDCCIWETCIQTKQAINDKTKSWIFNSANYRDYSSHNDNTVFENDLIADCTLNNIKYAKDFHLLRKHLSDMGLA